MNNNANSFPENTVEEMIDPAKNLRNPFNGASVFLPSNDPTAASGYRIIPGAIAVGYAQDSSTGGMFDYYAFIFQGTDSKDPINYYPELCDFHAGMSVSINGLREGVFFTKVRQ